MCTVLCVNRPSLTSPWNGRVINKCREQIIVLYFKYLMTWSLSQIEAYNL